MWHCPFKLYYEFISIYIIISRNKNPLYIEKHIIMIENDIKKKKENF